MSAFSHPVRYRNVVGGEDYEPIQREGAVRHIQTCTTLLSDIASGALKLAFPPRCAGCERIDSHGFCSECRSMLEWIDWKSSCRKCGSSGSPVRMKEESPCPACCNNLLLTAQVIAAFRYSGPLVPAIIRWKYRNHEYLSGLFGKLMVEWIIGYTQPWWDAINFIIPTPHHPSTVKKRGFNPPDDIARIVAESFAIPLLPYALFKIRETLPQAKLKGTDRLRNLHESMHVFDHSILEGKTVLMIDDVMTTGATMNECARAVLKAGATKVYGFVLARQSTV